jgi:hypothetical protein
MCAMAAVALIKISRLPKIMAYLFMEKLGKIHLKQADSHRQDMTKILTPT